MRRKNKQEAEKNLKEVTKLLKKLYEYNGNKDFQKEVEIEGEPFRFTFVKGVTEIYYPDGKI